MKPTAQAAAQEATTADPLARLEGVLDFSRPTDRVVVDDGLLQQEVEKVSNQRTAAALAALVRVARDCQKSFKKMDRQALDELIAAVDEKISGQVAEVMHAKAFQDLEASWRGLSMIINSPYLIDETQVHVLNVTKDELAEDFEDNPAGINRTHLFELTYRSSYDTAGGEPYSAMIGNYSFSQSSADIELLTKLSNVGAVSHCPFMGSVNKEFFGFDDINELYRNQDLGDIFAGPQFIKWRAFRETEDSRYIGLCTPRMLMREPYGPDDWERKAKTFNFDEGVDGKTHDHFLWGNANYGFACNLIRAFTKYGMPVSIIGSESGGKVEDLPVVLVDKKGDLAPYPPTETPLDDTKELALAERFGLIPLTWYKNSDRAVFFSAQSAQKAEKFYEAFATANANLMVPLPYIFLISRLSHCVKVMNREWIGSQKEVEDLKPLFERWIKNFVTADPSAPEEQRRKFPLREAELTLVADPERPGFYKSQMFLRPWFQYKGLDLKMSLVSQLPSKMKK